MRIPFALALLAGASLAGAADRQLLWGDTHLHTSYSSDAYTTNNLTADADVAFRFARGEPVIHPFHRARVQIHEPLDFLAVSDHGEFLGQIRNLHLHGVDTSGLDCWAALKARAAAWVLTRAIDVGGGNELFVDVLPDPTLTPEQDAHASSIENSQLRLLPMPAQVEIDNWRALTDTAERYNEPGTFTALIGWEWSSTPGGANLHRVILTDSDAKTAQQYQPFGLDESPYPADLWAWLDKTSAATGARFLAIPHNSNISKGYMFSDTTLRGEPFDAEYIALRSRFEKVAEITQIKGDSETHPLFSPADEFADFERYPWYIQRHWTEYQPQAGDFLRPALKRGLELERRLGANPYRLGVIGSTDAHTALSSAEEDNFLGKLATDSIPANKQTGWKEGEPGATGWAMSASGRAAVWATGNTRAAIIDALARREVYGTTGPRIAVQFFGGADFNVDDLDATDLYAAATARGVPMGGELARLEQAPSFIVVAAMDPAGAQLDRIQIIKGWLDAAGGAQEQVFDVAWSNATGERMPDAAGKLPPVGNTVNLRTGRTANTIGAPQLRAVWRDPGFDPAQPAFYYARVLEIPTARHSLLDAVALGQEHAGDYPDTIQERAYTSAIWYTPQGQTR